MRLRFAGVEIDTDAYELESFADYEMYADEADAKFEEGAKADAAGDEFELANVYFAVSLFPAERYEIRLRQTRAAEGGIA